MSREQVSHPLKIEVREFLNTKGHLSIAAIHIYTNYHKKGVELSHYGIVISDCSRSIELALGVRDLDVANNSLYKVNVLIENLAKVRDNIEAQIETFKRPVVRVKRPRKVVSGE